MNSYNLQNKRKLHGRTFCSGFKVFLEKFNSSLSGRPNCLANVTQRDVL